MDRLTHNDDEGEVELRIGKSLEYIQPVYEKLSSYEDTGCTPQEVNDLIAQNERLTSQLNTAVEDIQGLLFFQKSFQCSFCKNYDRSSACKSECICVTPKGGGVPSEWQWRGFRQFGDN